MGNHIVDDFDNVNPDNVNSELNKIEGIKTELVINVNEQGDLASVDTNGDGKVTISEAKKAGYKMPIKSDHWLYIYMDDRDGDGMVGE